MTTSDALQIAMLLCMFWNFHKATDKRREWAERAYLMAYAALFAALATSERL